VVMAGEAGEVAQIGGCRALCEAVRWRGACITCHVGPELKLLPKATRVTGICDERLHVRLDGGLRREDATARDVDEDAVAAAPRAELVDKVVARSRKGRVALSVISANVRTPASEGGARVVSTQVVTHQTRCRHAQARPRPSRTDTCA
jgi:hypothetical protein